jgi:hypothetical protein
MGVFGGRAGKTYDTYVDIVNTFQIPSDKTFVPLLFPVQYALAMGANVENAPISTSTISSDLTKLRKELQMPIVIIIDEGNVLSLSKVILQQLRNILQHVTGYMVILAGTGDLFPVMNAVFSPVARQFKRIDVEPFDRLSDTEDCVTKPLEKLGIPVETVLPVTTYFEIHKLSSGSPYEIQLICHYLFRRLQDGRSTTMTLNFGVLEDVRHDLEASENIARRPVLTHVRSLITEQLSALSVLCACDGGATLEQTWAIEYIIHGAVRWTEPGLRAQLEDLVARGVVADQEGLLQFKGDDFDRLYTKYFASERGISVDIYPRSPVLFWLRTIRGLVADNSLFDSVKELFPSRVDRDPRVVAQGLESARNLDELVSKSGPMIVQLYTLMVQGQEYSEIPLYRITLSFPWLQAVTWYYVEGDIPGSVIDVLHNMIQEMSLRAREVDGILSFDSVPLPVVPRSQLAALLVGTASDEMRRNFALIHLGAAAERYINGGDLSLCLEDARFGYLNCLPALDNQANIYAYLLTASMMTLR